jgi:Xaa-Pro aminopeptidase
MLDPVKSRGRQRRLLEAVREMGIDAVVVGAAAHVYWLSGHLANWLHQAGLVVLGNGRSWLCAANKAVENLAVDEPAHYEAQWLATLRPEQPAVVAEKTTAFLKSNGARKIAVDASSVTSQIALSGEFEVKSVDPILWQLRRRKDDDELKLLRKAIDCTRTMHARAREIVRPGVLEIDVFNELHAAAVRTAGEPLTTNLGNDFACGTGGGPPRNGRQRRKGSCTSWTWGRAIAGTSRTTAARMRWASRQSSSARLASMFDPASTSSRGWLRRVCDAGNL